MSLLDRLIGFLEDRGIDDIKEGGLYIDIKANDHIVIRIIPEGRGDFINVEAT